jgi:gliding motility-associated-like protein
LKPYVSYLLLLLLLFAASEASSTHLVGGSMSYEYLGPQNNGKFRYRLTVRMYRDCAPTPSVKFDPAISIGFYNNNSERSLQQLVSVNLISNIPVDPLSGGSDCPFQPQVCLEQGIYQGIADVPASAVGYHLVFQRCCRNVQENILDDLGQTYYAFIPATSIRNNSPFFTEVPSPYICVNDLVSILNTARDIDGDSLVYRLSLPWAGGNVNSPIPEFPLSWPQIPNFESVTYKNGYNYLLPFGAGGISTIDSRNGVTELLSKRQGRFAIAIDVFEYRNGVFLSAVRLDVQMIIVACTPNKTPAISTSGNTFGYEVTEGEQICFDILSTDEDNHTIKLSATGDIFTGGPDFGNTASFQNKSAKSTVRSQFCWTPSCGRASSIPYLFTAEAIDDGCPPKRRLDNISILVKPFSGARDMNGPAQVCANQTEILYWVSGSATSSFSWQVTGGTIVSGQGSDSILIHWGNGSTGKVEVTEISKGGCEGETLSKTVEIMPAPARLSISGKDTVCEFTAGVVYTTSAIPGNSIRWFSSGGTITGPSDGSSVMISWLEAGNGTIMAIQTNSLGCRSDTSYFFVSIVKSEIDSLLGSSSVCPNIRGVEYKILRPGENSAYIWSISGGRQASGGNSPRITVDWEDNGTGFVEVYEISKFGCVSDPVRLNVIRNHALQGMLPAGKDTLCELSTGIRYEVIATNNSIYNWSISNGTILEGNQSNSVLVEWGNTGNGQITVQEISFDSINNIPCIGQTRTLHVYLAPYPVAQPVTGPDEICQGDSATLFSINGMEGSVYHWTYSGSQEITGQGNDSVHIRLNEPGNFMLSVIETSRYGCKGPEIKKEITVHPRPITEGISGPEIICFPDYGNQLYSVEGFANSRYNWQVDGASIVSGQNTREIMLTFSGQAENSVSVVEISEFGCYGDTLRKNIFADNPSIDLRVISVNWDDDKKMEISWKLNNAPRYNSNFQIQRRIAGDAATVWMTSGTVENTGSFYLDQGVHTDDHIYEYRVIGFNLCGDTLYSEIHRNVQIKGIKNIEDEYAVLLGWSRYGGWDNGVMHYELYRKDGENSYVLLNNTEADTSDSYADGTKSYRHCYRIKATEKEGAEISWSNEICFTFSPILIVPNAFTPNSDGLNTFFEIVSASIKTFSITIYSRWGEVLYEGNDASSFWDGTYNGKPCQEGVYVYVIRYTGYDNRPKFEKGNVTLLR